MTFRNVEFMFWALLGGAAWVAWFYGAASAALLCFTLLAGTGGFDPNLKQGALGRLSVASVALFAQPCWLKSAASIRT
jgi:hypothetical protein